ncbi:MAG: DUF2848 domain-containing protein [Granulosicoccus sp.]
MNFTVAVNVLDVPIQHVYVAGWTGRNKAAVDHHIAELAAIGIDPPSQVPLYYRVSNSLLSQDSIIEVLGNGTSGEVEPLVVKHQGELYLGLASDHTDRELEAHSVAASKQACLKPAAKELWKLDSVLDHLDSLILRCQIKEDGQWISYQEGALSSIRPLAELVQASGLDENSAMLCGTLGAIGGVRAASDYKMELEDPVLNRKLLLNYSVVVLPVIN